MKGSSCTQIGGSSLPGRMNGELCLSVQPALDYVFHSNRCGKKKGLTFRAMGGMTELQGLIGDDVTPCRGPGTSSQREHLWVSCAKYISLVQFVIKRVENVLFGQEQKSLCCLGIIVDTDDWK